MSKTLKDQSQIKWISDFIWNIADDRLRDVDVRGKYRDVILPFTVLRRFDAARAPCTLRHVSPQTGKLQPFFIITLFSTSLSRHRSATICCEAGQRHLRFSCIMPLGSLGATMGLPDEELPHRTKYAKEASTPRPARLKFLLISFLVLYVVGTAIIIIMRGRHRSQVVEGIAFRALSPGQEFFEGHGVRFVLDTRAAPDMRSWGERKLVVLSQWYPKILLILSTRDFHPPSMVIVEFDNFSFVPFPSSDTKHQPYMVQSGTNVTFVGGSGDVAFAVGNTIHLSARHYRYDRSDGGSLVHEEVHVLQGGAGPSWLVEGVADYIRWYLYEPAPLNPPMGGLNCNPQYNDSYQITANFLAYLTRRYGDLVGPLTVAMRQHRYNDSIWEKLTGVDLSTLNSQWRAHVAESIQKGYIKTAPCR